MTAATDLVDALTVRDITGAEGVHGDDLEQLAPVADDVPPAVACSTLGANEEDLRPAVVDVISNLQTKIKF